jgi:delta-aminolevulinic acid dehydratase/porphobilinogen synthase
MCYKIDSTFVLIHHLRTKKSCTIREIVARKTQIEKAIPSVFIDVSRRSILQTISSYPEIFEWENEQIIKRDSASEYFESPVIDYFNINVEKCIRPEVIALLET